MADNSEIENKKIGIEASVTADTSSAMKSFDELAKRLGYTKQATQNLSTSAKQLENTVGAMGKEFKSVSQQVETFRKQLNTAQKAGFDFALAVNSIGKSKSTLTSFVKEVAALAGATVSLGHSLETAVGYNKDLVVLASQFAKYGVGVTQVEKSLDSLSKQLNITKSDTLALFKAYEKQFPYASLKGAENLLKNIRKVVGSNTEELNKMSSVIASIAQQYPEMQESLERMDQTDKQRLKSQLALLAATGKINQETYRSMMDYVAQNKQVSAEDEKRLQQAKAYAEMMGDMKRIWQEVALVIGKVVMPYMQKLADFLKNNEGTLKTIASLFAKIAVPAIAIAGAVKLTKGLAQGAAAGGHMLRAGGGLIKGAFQGYKEKGLKGLLSGGLKGAIKGGGDASAPDGTESKPFYVKMIDAESTGNNSPADQLKDLVKKGIKIPRSRISRTTQYLKGGALRKLGRGFTGSAKQLFKGNFRSAGRIFGQGMKGAGRNILGAGKSLLGRSGGLRAAAKSASAIGGATKAATEAAKAASVASTAAKAASVGSKALTAGKVGLNLAKVAGPQIIGAAVAMAGQWGFGKLESSYQDKEKEARARGDEASAKSYEKKAAGAGLGKAAMGVGGAALTGAAIGGMVGSVVPVIGNAVGAGVGAVVGGVVGLAVNFKSIAKNVGTLLKDNPLTRGLKTFGKGVWSVAQTAGKGLWSGMKYIGGLWLSGYKWLFGMIGSALKGLWNGMKAIGSKLWGAAKWVGGKVWGAAKVVVGPVWNGMKTIGGGMWQGAKWLGGKAMGAASKIGSAFMKYSGLGYIMGKGKEEEEKERLEAERRAEQERKEAAANKQKAQANVTSHMDRIRVQQDREEAQRASVLLGQSVTIRGQKGQTAKEKLEDVGRREEENRDRRKAVNEMLANGQLESSINRAVGGESIKGFELDTTGMTAEQKESTRKMIIEGGKNVQQYIAGLKQQGVNVDELQKSATDEGYASLSRQAQAASVAYEEAKKQRGAGQIDDKQLKAAEDELKYYQGQLEKVEGLRKAAFGSVDANDQGLVAEEAKLTAMIQEQIALREAYTKASEAAADVARTEYEIAVLTGTLNEAAAQRATKTAQLRLKQEEKMLKTQMDNLKIMRRQAEERIRFQAKTQAKLQGKDAQEQENAGERAVATSKELLETDAQIAGLETSMLNIRKRENDLMKQALDYALKMVDAHNTLLSANKQLLQSAAELQLLLGGTQQINIDTNIEEVRDNMNSVFEANLRAAEEASKFKKKMLSEEYIDGLREKKAEEEAKKKIEEEYRASHKGAGDADVGKYMASAEASARIEAVKTEALKQQEGNRDQINAQIRSEVAGSQQMLDTEAKIRNALSNNNTILKEAVDFLKMQLTLKKQYAESIDQAAGAVKSEMEAYIANVSLTGQGEGAIIGRMKESLGLLDKRREAYQAVSDEAQRLQEAIRGASDGKVDANSQQVLDILEKRRKAQIEVLMREGKSREEAEKTAQESYDSMRKSLANGTALFQLQTEEKNASVKILATERERQQTVTAITSRYKDDLELASQQTSLLEATINLQNNYVTGLGASVAMREKLIESIQRERQLKEKQIADLDAAIKEAGMDEAKAKVLAAERNKLELERLGLMQKEADAAKEMREGWVSAINAQTIGTGRIMKFKISEDNNMRQALKMGAYTTARSGAIQNSGFRQSEQFQATENGQLSIRGGRMEGQGYNPTFGPTMGQTNSAVTGRRDQVVAMVDQQLKGRVKFGTRGTAGMALGSAEGLSAATAGNLGTGASGTVTGNGSVVPGSTVDGRAVNGAAGSPTVTPVGVDFRTGLQAREIGKNSPRVRSGSVDVNTGLAPSSTTPTASGSGQPVTISVTIYANSKEDVERQLITQLRRAFNDVDFGRSQ